MVEFSGRSIIIQSGKKEDRERIILYLNLLRDPRSVSLSGGKEKVFEVSLTIPENLSLGDYILTLEAIVMTEEILDDDSFRVRVVGSRGGKIAVYAN